MTSVDQSIGVDEFTAVFAAVRTELSRVVIGQRRALDELLAAVFAGGHSLLSGMPGLGRTLIVKSLSTILGLEFRRVQFTPDLLPTDLVGMEVLEDDRTSGGRRSRLHKGPVFGNLLLADEVNRSPARTQSALLEAMQERQATIGGVTHPLPEPFILIATENCIETDGVWPLGEAQVDRFMVSILLDYPSEAEEERIISATTGTAAVAPRRVADGRLVLAMQALARQVPVIPSARQLAVTLVRMSRPGEPDAPASVAGKVRLGASPRAAQALLAGAKVLALARGRRHVTRQDVADLAAPVLRHRVLLDLRARAHGTQFESILPVLTAAAWAKSMPRFGVWSRKVVDVLRPASRRHMEGKETRMATSDEQAMAASAGTDRWSDTDLAKLGHLRDAHDKLLPQIRKAVVGQNKVVRQVLIGLFSQGHCLLVGVPGLAKTLLVRTLAATLSLRFKRIQFTPDLMPSDITGTEVIEENKATGERIFRFVPGPIFTNMLLADEINRTPPKTQAALLEAMEEKSVTVGGMTRQLERPFFVLATQNPIEQEGTYPLPEAQLDRFMFQINVGYPTEAEEDQIMTMTTSGRKVEIVPVLSQQEIVDLQELVRRIAVPREAKKTALRLVRATRVSEPEAAELSRKWLTWGAGPRACQYLILGAKSVAALAGRPAIDVPDVLEVAEAVLGHRLVLNFAAQAEGMTAAAVVSELLKSV